jgi:hypothetical protein
MIFFPSQLFFIIFYFLFNYFIIITTSHIVGYNLGLSIFVGRDYKFRTGIGIVIYSFVC